jgi:hypothetical protein
MIERKMCSIRHLAKTAGCGMMRATFKPEDKNLDYDQYQTEAGVKDTETD